MPRERGVAKDAKTPRTPRAPRAPRTPMTPRMPRAPRTPRTPKRQGRPGRQGSQTPRSSCEWSGRKAPGHGAGWSHGAHRHGAGPRRRTTDPEPGGRPNYGERGVQRERATCNEQRATRNAPRAACTVPRATPAAAPVRRAGWNVPRAPCNARRATCRVPHPFAGHACRGGPLNATALTRRKGKLEILPSTPRRARVRQKGPWPNETIDAPTRPPTPVQGVTGERGTTPSPATPAEGAH